MIEGIARRDRLVVLAGLVVAAALAWLYLIDMALDMGSDMAAGGGAMMRMQAWSVTHGLLMWAMWAVMMIAMMVPSAAPMILIFARVDRSKGTGGAYTATTLFALGYVAVWAGFSVAATAMQWGLQNAALLSPMMVATSTILGGILFIAAGVYQWTPLKYACLKHCRSPMAFIMGHWRPGRLGAFRMGLGHGAFCLGCCGFVMGVLFVGGVMNLAWVGGDHGLRRRREAYAQGRMGRARGRRRHGRCRGLPPGGALKAGGRLTARSCRRRSGAGCR